MPGAHDKDVSFSVNKYHEADLKDRKTTIANTIINACFMVPGNNPSTPLAGVNITQYFYKEDSAISSDKIKKDIEATCGRIICGATIGAVDFSVQTTSIGEVVFLLLIRVKFSPDEEEMLGITMQQKQNKYVHFNFDYVAI